MASNCGVLLLSIGGRASCLVTQNNPSHDLSLPIPRVLPLVIITVNRYYHHFSSQARVREATWEVENLERGICRFEALLFGGNVVVDRCNAAVCVVLRSNNNRSIDTGMSGSLVGDTPCLAFGRKRTGKR